MRSIPISLTIVFIMSLFASGCSSQATAENTSLDTTAVPMKDSLENGDAGESDSTAAMQEVKEVIPEEVLSVDDLLGKIDQSKDERFVHIDPKFTNKPKIYLRKEAYDAFLEMRLAAKAEGIDLLIVSAMRNFNYQKGIWERKWTGTTKVRGKNLTLTHPDPVQRAEKILKYSSMPGTSRHHWGTDIDLNTLNNEWFDAGQGKKLYDWMTKNAGKYGYCQVYSPIDTQRPTGYQEEKWHWSYMPLASEYLSAYIRSVDYEKLTGFKGSDAAKELNVIENYVAGISPDCK